MDRTIGAVEKRKKLPWNTFCIFGLGMRRLAYDKAGEASIIRESGPSTAYKTYLGEGEEKR